MTLGPSATDIHAAWLGLTTLTPAKKDNRMSARAPEIQYMNMTFSLLVRLQRFTPAHT